jgi:outer membrane protein OmpA-like peptidoglycan-associated protein
MSSQDVRHPRLPGLIWVAIIAWIVLAVLAALWGVPNEEDDLANRADELLVGTGLSVDLAGRDATIIGTADQATIDSVAAAVYDLRGVRRVDISAAEVAAPPATTTTAAPETTTTIAPATTTTAAAVAGEPSFTAVQTGGVVELTGTLPDQAIVDAIAAGAAEVYGEDRIESRMEVGAVSAPDYLTALPELFAVARGLDPWEFRLQDGQVTFTGMGPDRDTVANKRNAFAQYREDAAFPAVQASLETDPDAVAASLTDLLAGGANFETGSAILSADAKIKLNQVIRAMMENPSTVLTVEGHTDDQGDEAANQQLSEARAQAVVDYLVDGGIAADRLTAVGYGEERPIANNNTAEGRARNRRIEFTVTEGE